MAESTTVWWIFWTLCFGVAALCFASIAVVVLIRGVGDLRTMIRLLTSKHNVE